MCLRCLLYFMHYGDQTSSTTVQRVNLKKKPLSVLYIFFTLTLTSVLFLFSVLDGWEGSSASMSAAPPHTSVVSFIGRRRNSSSLHNVLCWTGRCELILTLFNYVTLMECIYFKFLWNIIEHNGLSCDFCIIKHDAEGKCSRSSILQK